LWRKEQRIISPWPARSSGSLGSSIAGRREIVGKRNAYLTIVVSLPDVKEKESIVTMKKSKKRLYTHTHAAPIETV
jgi:hypothetical protein